VPALEEVERQNGRRRTDDCDEATPRGERAGGGGPRVDLIGSTLQPKTEAARKHFARPASIRPSIQKNSTTTRRAIYTCLRVRSWRIAPPDAGAWVVHQVYQARAADCRIVRCLRVPAGPARAHDRAQ